MRITAVISPEANDAVDHLHYGCEVAELSFLSAVPLEEHSNKKRNSNSTSITTKNAKQTKNKKYKQPILNKKKYRNR